MPPEVCLGQPYDQKADVWALGVILYELITLKKPFESETIHGVLQQIVKHPYEPLPDDTDTDLVLLVRALLNKDHLKRPSIYDVASIPVVRNGLIAFIQEQEILDDCVEAMDYIDPDFRFGRDGDQDSDQSNNEKKVEVSDYMDAQMEDWTEMMYSEIELTDLQNGWFGKIQNTARG